MWTGPHRFGPVFSRIQKRKDQLQLQSMALGVKRPDWTGLPNTSWDSLRVGSFARVTKSWSMKSPVAPVSTMASMDISSIVSVVFRWIGSIMHFASSSREQMTSLRFIYFSHLGQCGLQGSVGGSAGVSGSCASSSIFSSVISRTENRLLLSNGGARLTRCGIQNPLH